MTQPVESVYRAFAMKTKLNIDIKFDIAKVITSITGLILALAHIFQYI